MGYGKEVTVQRSKRTMRRAVLKRLFDLLEWKYGISLGRDQLDGVSLHEIDALLSFKSEPKLDELRGALDRIDEGTFGTCISCKRKISQDLLDADPARRMCPACEQEFSKPTLHLAPRVRD
jgi:RNA polymerase-binding transcription factor DksA